MRKLILAMLLLLTLPLGVFAQQDEVPADVDVEEIAESVVTVLALQRGQPVGSGSGTIVEPNGVVYTNRHVVEAGRDYAILMLDDLGDPPELRYYASLVGVSDAIDFAILQIDRDADGNPVDPASLDLNPVPIADEVVEVGDEIQVFGFPGISEGLLTVTSGEIVTVQNGSMYNERLPVWYWTDAEISSGNSGGLTINADGEFIGIPTWVRAEARTAGRFGGVLPYQAILVELGTTDRVPTEPEQEAEQEAEQEEEAPAGPDVELVLENNDDEIVCYVYISSTEATEWGGDELGDTEVVEPGETRVFEVEPDFYDVRFDDCDGEVLNDIRNVDLTEDVFLSHVDTFESNLSRAPAETFDTQDAAEEITVTLENQDDTTICYVYISPTTAMQWGEDQLGDTEVIETGQTATFTIAPGTYDILLEDCNRGLIDEAYGLDLSTDTALIQEPV